MKKKNVKKKTSIMNNDFLNDLLKTTDNPFATLASEETLSKTTDWINTGCKALNGLISSDINRGIPNNKITLISGLSGSGKTYLILSIVKSAIAKGYKVIYFDSENTLEKNMLEKRGINPSEIGIVNVDTVQNWRNQMLSIINAYNETKTKDKQKLLLVLDSMGNLSTTKEIEDSEKKGNNTTDMTRAKMLKATFRILQLKLAEAKIPLLMSNHTYQSLSFIPEVIQSGGTGAVYSASIIINLTRSKAKDKDKNVIGFFFNCHTTKNRYCKPESKLKIYLDFKQGLHKYYGLQEFGEPMLQKVKGGWKFKDEKIKEKDLWQLNWEKETDLLSLIRQNIIEKFSFGEEKEIVELSDVLEEKE